MRVNVFYCDSPNEELSIRGDWHSLVLEQAERTFPYVYEQLQFEICVKFLKSAKAVNDVRREFTKSVCDEVRDMYSEDATVECISIVACIPVALYYFGDGVGGGKKELIQSVKYRANQTLAKFVETTVKLALVKYEIRGKKFKLTSKGTLVDDFELRFKKDLALVRDDSLLQRLCDNDRTVFLRAKHTSYSHTTSLIVREFNYPDIGTLVKANTDPTEVLRTLVAPEHANATIRGNIFRYASSRKDAVEEFYRSHPSGSLLPVRLAAWNDCVTKCQDQLLEIKDTTPELYHYNEQFRRQLMDVMIRRVCVMNKWLMLVENKLCVDQEHPPPSFTGTGPIDYTFGGRSLQVVTVPVRDAKAEEIELLNAENEESVEAGHVGASEEGKIASEYSETKASFQALGEGHDLLQVPNCVNVELDYYRNRFPRSSSKRSAMEQEAGSSYDTKQAESSYCLPVPVPFVRKTAAALLSTGQRYKVFHLEAPFTADELPSVYYGGEYPLRVLRYAVPTDETAGSFTSTTSNSGAAAGVSAKHRDTELLSGQTIPDLDEIRVIVALLSLAGRGRLMLGDDYTIEKDGDSPNFH